MNCCKRVRYTAACFCLVFVILLPADGNCAEPDALIGWGGDHFKHSETFSHSIQSKRWVETLSWHPRAFLYHGFVTDEEADQLIIEAAPRMKRSTVVGEKAGTVDEIRTSYGSFLGRLSSPTVEELEKKLANWTQLPIVHQEDVQILRYEHGQKYGAHYDSLGRVCTVLVFLSTPEEGGETAFPKTTDSDWADPAQLESTAGFSECAMGHVAAKPKKGDALLFYSLKPDGKTQDDLAMHTGCPLISGVKWTATIWMHPIAFRPDDFHKVYHSDKRNNEPGVSREDDAGVCMDTNEKCADWAAVGECTSNPMYMVGTGSDAAGACRKSCGQCRVCSQGDAACYHKNREHAGYLDLTQEVRQLTGRDLPAQF